MGSGSSDGEPARRLSGCDQKRFELERLRRSGVEWNEGQQSSRDRFKEIRSSFEGSVGA